MIGLILIYFIGRQFYVLANEYQHNRWLFTILGIASYYFGVLLFGFIVVWLSNYSEYFFDLMHKTQLVQGLVSMPMGLICGWVFFHLLRANWQKRRKADFSQFEMIDREGN